MLIVRQGWLAEVCHQPHIIIIEDLHLQKNFHTLEFSLPIPQEKDFNFEDKYINIRVPFVPSKFPEYSTYQKAKSAAKEAIDRAMFSKRKSIVQDIINNYRIDKLSPYYDYAESENNFFYSANKKAQTLLKEFIGEIQANNPNITVPENLLIIQSRAPSAKKKL